MAALRPGVRAEDYEAALRRFAAAVGSAEREAPPQSNESIGR